MSILNQLVNDNKTVRAFVSRLLDKIDRSKEVPGVFSCKLEHCSEPETISRCFGHINVTICTKSVKLNLKKLIASQPDIINRLYAALGREQLNIPVQKARTAKQLFALLSKYIEEAKPGVLRSYLEEQRRLSSDYRGELFKMSFKGDIYEVQTLIDCLKRGFAALSSDTDSLRLSHFGLQVANDTKCCRSGSAMLNRFADLLYRYDASIKDDVDLLQPASHNERLRAIFDHSCLILDGSASQIQVFGNLVFDKGGQRFDYVQRHAKIGDPVVLTSANLHGAKLVAVPEKLVSIENETSFFDYIQQADPSQAMVVCTMGHANHLMVRFMRDLSSLIKEFWHWGDLDRSGVLILESLRQRTGIDIMPLNMNVETLQAQIDKGKKLAATEKSLIEKLLISRPEIVCYELLAEIAAAGVWLEQENICC